jgi:hypothetical protein
MTEGNSRDTFETFQRVFIAPWPRVNDAAAEQVQTFWKNQEKILESLRELSQSWFERRRTATQAAIETAKGFAEAKSPVDVFQGMQGWLIGSANRVMADGLACQKHMINVAEACAAHIPPEAAEMKKDVMSTVAAMRDAQSRAAAA